MKQIYQTPIRQLILEYFNTLHQPSSIDQISQFLESKELKCEFSTVFRQVKNMVKDGLLKEFFLENKSKMYELAEAGDNFHYHIICNNCSKVFCEELQDDKFVELKNILDLSKLINIAGFELKIKGLCVECG